MQSSYAWRASTISIRAQDSPDDVPEKGAAQRGALVVGVVDKGVDETCRNYGRRCVGPGYG
jgi:hypothetical protein